MTVGIDIVDISEFQHQIESSPIFLDKLLSPDEQAVKNLPSLAGKIAAKEAVIKTGYLKIGEWLSIQIPSDETGAPIVYNALGERLSELQVSISHTKHTAIAVALYEKNKNT